VTYGDVIDKAARKNVSICGRAEQDGGLSRVYVSQSNLINIIFTSPRHHQHNFILHVDGNSSTLKQSRSLSSIAVSLTRSLLTVQNDRSCLDVCTSVCPHGKDVTWCMSSLKLQGIKLILHYNNSPKLSGTF